MEEECEGVRIITWLTGLSGLALITWLFWGGMFWPFSLFPLFFMFPLFNRATQNYNVIFVLMIVYGAVELVIAWGLREKMNWSRVALLCLAGIWIGYAVWDSLNHPMIFGNPAYSYVDPLAIAAAVYWTVLVAYMFSKNARACFHKQ